MLLLLHPQYRSTYGHALAIVMSRDELFSMADIVTPNVREASKLLGDVSLHTISDMRNAAESIYKLGPKYVFSISVNLFCLPYLFSYPICVLSRSCASYVTSGQTQCRRLPHEWGLGEGKTEASLPPAKSAERLLRTRDLVTQ